MNILQVIGTLDPTYGGPVEALRQMTIALNELGYRSESVTLDAPDAPWILDFPGKVYALGPSQLKYRYNPQLVPWLEVHIKNYDAVIACGIWQYQSLAVWQVARRQGFPYFVFIHGALDPWFKHAFPLKHIKKWLYWSCMEHRVLRDARAVLFRSEGERLLARESFWLYRVHEAVVDNGICAPEGNPDLQRELFLNAYPVLRNKKAVLFMSRIHEKKGCDLLIEAFAREATRDNKLHLVMAGPDQAGWQLKLEQLAKELDVADRITWTGMLVGDLKWGALRAADTFILPSHSENFGIVVVEALACGVPVLISDKVNICQEIVQDQAGLVAPDTEAGTVSLLERWLSLSADERQRMREQAKLCFANRFEIHQAAKKLMNVIQSRLSDIPSNGDRIADSLVESDRRML